MHRIALPLLALVVGAALVSAAAAATDPSLPPTGSYAFSGGGGPSGSFKVNSTRSAVTNLRFSFTVGGSGQCSSAKLPQGKIAASVASPLKLTAAHRGGYTTYIVGRSTPKTSNGISTIPTTFKLSPGDKVKGVMDIGFNYNHPTGGSGPFTVGDCSLTLMGFAKR